MHWPLHLQTRAHTHTPHTPFLFFLCVHLCCCFFCAQDSVRKGVVRAVNAVKSYQRKPRGRPHDRAKRDNLSCDGLQIAKKKKKCPASTEPSSPTIFAPFLSRSLTGVFAAPSHSLYAISDPHDILEEKDLLAAGLHYFLYIYIYI